MADGLAPCTRMFSNGSEYEYDRRIYKGGKAMSKIDINITRRVDKFRLTPAMLALVTVLGMIATVVLCLLVFLEVI